jgi:hypothetical protein
VDNSGKIALPKMELPPTELLRAFIPDQEYIRSVEHTSVEFRLVYQGPLVSQKSGGGGSRIAEKHAIRKVFHKQLQKVWQQRRVLDFYLQERCSAEPSGNIVKFRIADKWINKYSKYGFRFLPLITEEAGLACSIDILFLRPDPPGKIRDSSGDIDNRIKVLLDGLRTPRYPDEAKGLSPDPDENPFFVLLEDDSLITEMKITTDRLLTADVVDENVLLIIDVNLLVVNPTTTREFFEFYV